MLTARSIPEINHDDKHLLDEVHLFALDLDGTVYLGSSWIDGTLDFLRAVRSSGRDYVFLTNNSSRSLEDYTNKLHQMGLDAGRESIVTSGQATIFYLKKHFPGRNVFLLGNEALRQEFLDEGIELDETDPDVVVTAFDTSLDYRKMCKVCDFVRAGLPYIATHPDFNCPTETGFIPDIGSIHAFIHASAFRYPDTIIGKPYSGIAEYLQKRVNMRPDEIAMTGDRLYTDVAAGCRNGMHSILVLSGEATMEDAEVSEDIPDLIFRSLKYMIPFL